MREPTLVTESEFTAVGDLIVRAYEAGGVLGTDDGYRAVLADTRGRAAMAQVYVVHDDALKPLATVTLSPHGSAYAQVAQPGELEFRMLAVDPSVASRGLGTQLVGFCAEQALARGDQDLVLCVIDTNEAAIRLYKRLGFIHQPDRDLRGWPGVRLLVLTRAAGPRAGSD